MESYQREHAGVFLKEVRGVPGAPDSRVRAAADREDHAGAADTVASGPGVSISAGGGSLEDSGVRGGCGRAGTGEAGGAARTLGSAMAARIPADRA